jgi:hypothetical protein
MVNVGFDLHSEGKISQQLTTINLEDRLKLQQSMMTMKDGRMT